MCMYMRVYVGVCFCTYACMNASEDGAAAGMSRHDYARTLEKLHARCAYARACLLAHMYMQAMHMLCVPVPITVCAMCAVCACVRMCHE